mgnify:FL=1
MNSGVHQEVAPKIKRSMMVVRLVASTIILVLGKFGIIPLYIALISAGIISIETTIKLYATKSYAGQNF